MIFFGYFINNVFVYLFVLLIVFIIYLVSGRKTKNTIGNFVVSHIVIIILIGIMIYGWKKWGIVLDHSWIAEMNYSLFMGLGLFLLYEVGSNFLAVFRNNTTPFVANGVHGSCAIHYDIGMWTIWYLGTTGRFAIDSEGFVFPWPFPNKIAITPKVSWDFNGDSPVSITQVFKTDLNRLHPLLKRQIKKDSKTIFARGEIYFGIVSEKLRTDNPKLNELQNQIEQVNAKYNTLEESFDDVAVNSEKYEQHVRAKRILSRDEGVSRRPTSSGEME
jgi:hypothetical protein